MDSNGHEKALIPFRNPCNIGIFGQTQAGKSRFTRRLLENASSMFTDSLVSMYYCYAEWQPDFEIMENTIANINFHAGLPSREEICSWTDAHHVGQKLIVLDDLLTNAMGSNDIEWLMTAGGHHRNITNIIIGQNCFPRAKNSRTISLQFHYLVLFANKRDMSQMSTLGRQMFPKHSASFLDAFRRATEKPYSYLLVDLFPSSDPKYQLRTCIFPDEVTIVYSIK